MKNNEPTHLLIASLFSLVVYLFSVSTAQYEINKSFENSIALFYLVAAGVAFLVSVGFLQFKNKVVRIVLFSVGIAISFSMLLPFYVISTTPFDELLRENIIVSVFTSFLYGSVYIWSLFRKTLFRFGILGFFAGGFLLSLILVLLK